VKELKTKRGKGYNTKNADNGKLKENFKINAKGGKMQENCASRENI
jgi:hypothetical protein